ncbi:MAG TPA: type I-MYXAN CRISPR-associated endonuclease Cas1, partial [Gemmataceae bacterium]|nr:type I-MYXAN CRISPR-associated endonuclease Cas1 [Gemmataceae bacterium]
MIPLPVFDSHSPAMRIEALHALAYCERLFYFQEVERISVPHDRIFAGRELHASLEAADDGELTSIELASESWGLIGKVDCLRRRDGAVIPYEHKRGKPARGADGIVEPWPSDRVQLVAYAVLLEEAFDAAIPEGRIRYHAANVTVRVAIDESARADLRAAIARARQLRETVDRPPIAENERLCKSCSLAPVCLPEEVRHQHDPQHETVRMFPPERQGTNLHVVSQGAYVGRSGDCLVVRPREGPETKEPIRGLQSVVLHGFSQISTQALRFCTDHDLGVHWVSTGGIHFASLVAGAGQVQRRVRQYRALADETTCMRLARALVLAKIEGEHRYLLRATRSDRDSRQDLRPAFDGLQAALRSAGNASGRDSLRGAEGSAAVHYFDGLRALLGSQVPDELRWTSRNRRPPQDRFNALLSFGYGLLHTAVMQAILATGLEPSLGFFHTPRSAAYPLVLDLMELFRMPLWDLVLIGSLNRNQWDPAADFVVTKAKVWLS